MSEVATFAGGCFWCTEAVFQKLKGVEKVIPGYTGGKMENPTYEMVSKGNSGHAEAINITYDPKKISYIQLLKVFFATHDPTELNKQGADVGTQYRSAIFYHTQKQQKTAENYIQTTQKNYAQPIVTEIVEAQKFYPAEKNHFNYYVNNKSNTYCRLVIDPKIAKLYRQFTSIVKG